MCTSLAMMRLFLGGILIICSALFVLHDSMGRNGTGGSNDRALDAMEPLSIRITQFSLRLFGTGQDLNYGTFSPYVPLSLYQAAVVQLRLWKRSGEIVHEDNLRSLKHILEYYCRRWLIAGTCTFARTLRCLLGIDSQSADSVARGVPTCLGAGKPSFNTTCTR